MRKVYKLKIRTVVIAIEKYNYIWANYNKTESHNRLKERNGSLSKWITIIRKSLQKFVRKWKNIAVYFIGFNAATKKN